MRRAAVFIRLAVNCAPKLWMESKSRRTRDDSAAATG